MILGIFAQYNVYLGTRWVAPVSPSITEEAYLNTHFFNIFHHCWYCEDFESLQITMETELVLKEIALEQQVITL